MAPHRARLAARCRYAGHLLASAIFYSPGRRRVSSGRHRITARCRLPDQTPRRASLTHRVRSIRPQRIPGTLRKFIERGIVAEENRAACAENGRVGRPISRFRTGGTGPVDLRRDDWPSGMESQSGTGHTGLVWLPSGRPTHPTAPGYWYAFVSLPFLRFLILRWYFRILAWYRLLWSVRALPFHLNPFHPDRAAWCQFPFWQRISHRACPRLPDLRAQRNHRRADLARGSGLDGLRNGDGWRGLLPNAGGAHHFQLLRSPIGHGSSYRSAGFRVLASHFADAFRVKWIQRSREEEGANHFSPPPTFNRSRSWETCMSQ